MAVFVDLICSVCEARLLDQWSTLIGTPHIGGCQGQWERNYTLTRAPNPGAHPSEKCIVYVSEQEGGKIQYPGRNDAPMPERLRKRGYQKVEVTPSQLGSFERKYNVVNERRHFDRNGRGF